MSTNLKALIDKLNDTTRRALEAAAGLCVSRTHYDIEIEHYLIESARRQRQRRRGNSQTLWRLTAPG